MAKYCTFCGMATLASTGICDECTKKGRKATDPLVRRSHF